MSIVQLKFLHMTRAKLNLKNHSSENMLSNTNFCYLLVVGFQKKGQKSTFLLFLA